MPQTRANRRGRKSGNQRRRRLMPVSKGKAIRIADVAPRHPNLVNSILHQLTHPNSALANAVRSRVNAPRRAGPYRAPQRSKNTRAVIKDGILRHEKLTSNDASGPVNKGKGYNMRGSLVVTHPASKVPKWKVKRLREYKHNVYQTVLLSKSARIATSNNILSTFRHPIKAPSTLGEGRVQAMVFSPYCSGFTGVHTTFYRKIRADGTDVDHATTEPLDVIQNKADIQRHHLPRTTDATFGSPLQYEHQIVAPDGSAGTIDAAATQTTAALANVHTFYDQLLKGVKLDMTFMSSRCFPVKVSVSLIRHIQPTQPYTWSTSDKQQLLNNLNNRGLEWSDYKVEFCKEFTLPALKRGKKPFQFNLIKDIRTNVMQTNSFNDNNTAQDMVEANKNQLGLGLKRRSDEVADGFVSGQTYLLIKYRKVQQPLQFMYEQTLDTNLSGTKTASVQLPFITEESFDVPPNAGGGVPGDGSPANVDQGDETKASFYLHGKIVYNWGFREDTEAIPSVMSEVSANANYKKTQSLNIDPTLAGDNNNGIYTQSQAHQTRAT